MAKNIEGQNRANPVAFILSACLMLRHVGYGVHADAIEKGLKHVLKSGKLKTIDLVGGTTSTTDFTSGLIDSLGY